MTVYIDDARVARHGWAFARMWADDEAELHAVAEMIGLASAEQRCPPHVEHLHYLVSGDKKRRAAHAGVRTVDNFAFAEHVARANLPPEMAKKRLAQIADIRAWGRVKSL